MREVDYGVPEMHCGACEASIRRALERLEGVGPVRVDLEQRRVTVQFDDQRTDAQAVRERIERAGFDVAA